MIGKGGVTHNMLEDIHNHWKRAEAVRIKCLGVPTLDMENICFHLEVWNCEPPVNLYSLKHCDFSTGFNFGSRSGRSQSDCRINLVG